MKIEKGKRDGARVVPHIGGDEKLSYKDIDEN
jgi:hypothetical protein